MDSHAAQSWRDSLLRLNFWFEPHYEEVMATCATRLSRPTLVADNARAAAARERLAGGARIWNAWADGMLALRHGAREQQRFLRLWDHVAFLDARKISRAADVVLAGLVVPGGCRIDGGDFPVQIWASYARFHGEVDARGVVFKEEAVFENAEFLRAANFDHAVFGCAAQFRQVTLHGDASFDGAAFQKDAWFRGGTFIGKASFKAATFAGEAGFGNCRFGQGADYSGVQFHDNAGFDGAAFQGSSSFSDASFSRNSWFNAAEFDAATNFDHTRFLGRVDFSDARAVGPKAEMLGILSSINRRMREA